MIPATEKDAEIDGLIAQICVHRAMGRHCGRMEEIFTPLGMMHHQTGKDLRDVGSVLGIGGPILHAKDPKEILLQTTNLAHDPTELRPERPRFLLDRDYILSAMGLLARHDPELALRILKKHLETL